MKRTRREREQGFSLISVMIAASISAILIMGIIAALTSSMKGQRTLYSNLEMVDLVNLLELNIQKSSELHGATNTICGANSLVGKTATVAGTSITVDIGNNFNVLDTSNNPKVVAAAPALSGPLKLTDVSIHGIQSPLDPTRYDGFLSISATRRETYGAPSLTREVPLGIVLTTASGAVSDCAATLNSLNFASFMPQFRDNSWNFDLLHTETVYMQAPPSIGVQLWVYNTQSPPDPFSPIQNYMINPDRPTFTGGHAPPNFDTSPAPQVTLLTYPGLVTNPGSVSRPGLPLVIPGFPNLEQQPLALRPLEKQVINFNLTRTTNRVALVAHKVVVTGPTGIFNLDFCYQFRPPVAGTPYDSVLYFKMGCYDPGWTGPVANGTQPPSTDMTATWCKWYYNGGQPWIYGYINSTGSAQAMARAFLQASAVYFKDATATSGVYSCQDLDPAYLSTVTGT